MDILQESVERNLISFDEEQKYITYVHQGKKRNFQNPEEKVQAETFCRLGLENGYSAERIEMFSTVKMGVPVKESDLIVYADDEREKPYTVVECKSPDVSELEFKQAVEQAFSYAYAIAGTTKFIWVAKETSKNFTVSIKRKINEQLKPICLFTVKPTRKNTDTRKADIILTALEAKKKK